VFTLLYLQVQVGVVNFDTTSYIEKSENDLDCGVVLIGRQDGHLHVEKIGA
jgi:hypothetical protein